MKLKELITEETDNERLDAIYWVIKAIEEDLKTNSIEDILKSALLEEDLLYYN